MLVSVSLVLLFEIELSADAAKAFFEISGFAAFIRLLVKDSGFIRAEFFRCVNFHAPTCVMFEVDISGEDLLGFFIYPERRGIGIKVGASLDGFPSEKHIDVLGCRDIVQGNFLVHSV